MKPILLVLVAAAISRGQTYDLLVRGGHVIDPAPVFPRIHWSPEPLAGLGWAADGPASSRRQIGLW